MYTYPVHYLQPASRYLEEKVIKSFKNAALNKIEVPCSHSAKVPTLPHKVPSQSCKTLIAQPFNFAQLQFRFMY